MKKTLLGLIVIALLSAAAYAFTGTDLALVEEATDQYIERYPMMEEYRTRIEYRALLKLDQAKEQKWLGGLLREAAREVAKDAVKEAAREIVREVHTQVDKPRSAPEPIPYNRDMRPK